MVNQELDPNLFVNIPSMIFFKSTTSPIDFWQLQVVNCVIEKYVKLY